MDPTFARAFTQADRVVFCFSRNVALARNDGSFPVDIGNFHLLASFNTRFSDGGHDAGYTSLFAVRALSFEVYQNVGYGERIKGGLPYPEPETFLVAGQPKGRAFACRSPHRLQTVVRTRPKRELVPLLWLWVV